MHTGLTELEYFLKIRDNRAFTECQDRRCRALNGLGLSKADKVTLAAVPMFATLMSGLKQKRRGDCWLERGCAGVLTARLPDNPENGALRGYETKTNPVCRATPAGVMALKEFWLLPHRARTSVLAALCSSQAPSFFSRNPGMLWVAP